MSMRLMTFLLFTAGSCSRLSAADAVQLSREGDVVSVTIDGREFTSLRTSRTQPKPYFFPVRTADGVNIVRPLENPEDHPHHKGIWCSIDEVNEIKFWAEKGKIENHSLEITVPSGNPARLKIVNHWLGSDGKPVLIETVRCAIFTNRLMVYDAELQAGALPVTFGDTKEGLFGIRVANSLRGKEGGRITNAEGKQGEKECWGLPSKWVDYSGIVEGKTKGVALLDHPENFRASRFHVRDYGLFTLSPFGQSAYSNGQLPPDPLRLEPGQKIRLRYGLYVHDGDMLQGNIPAIYAQFLKATDTSAAD